MKYALFKDGKQISKAHSTKDAAAIEAYERGLVWDCNADFPGDKPGKELAAGYEINPIDNERN